jgi:hypothetical protein
MTTMQLRSRNNKRKRKALSDALVEFTPTESLDWMERCQVRLRDAMNSPAKEDMSCIETGIGKMDHVIYARFGRASCLATTSRRGSVVVNPQVAPPKKKMVRFASLVTVRVPFVSQEEEEEEVGNDQSRNSASSWYGPADYARFEMDCRRTIQAAIRALPANSSSKVLLEEEEFPLQGLEDFLSYETKQLRSFRRLSHCYNILYHQFIHRQHCNADQEEDYDSMVSILQRISERSSRESLQLALCRGKERMLYAFVDSE